MRSSNKSRSRNKNRNNRSNLGNVVNRVFDSSGPEGKVRGTPQQIIEKYQSLARDAQLSGDRVAHENFLQHAEHYVRMLGEAQKEMDQRREQQEAQRLQQQQNQEKKNQQHQQNQQKQTPAETSDEQPSIPDNADLFPAASDESNLVETPESKPVKAEKKPAPRKRTPKPKAEKPAKEPESPADLARAVEAKAAE